jgi:tRNA-splicing ligase RtcB
MRPLDRLRRIDDSTLEIVNPYGIEAKLFATKEVPIEAVAVAELLSVMQLKETLENIAKADKEFFGATPEITKMAVTPDFHKGAGIPVGTVLETKNFLVPQAIGNDINCGMRLHPTSLSADKVMSKLDQLETSLRHAYFEGGRDIAMTQVQREAMLRDGVAGLANSVPKSQAAGLWQTFHASLNDYGNSARLGVQCSSVMPVLHGFVKGFGDNELNRDGQVGSIGGGNHFVELQRVEKVIDSQIAYHWGLRANQVVVMVHSGSVAIGHAAGGFVKESVRGLYPKGLAHPANSIFPLPVSSGRNEKQCKAIFDAIANAENFAYANRMFLALMALKALRETYGDVGSSLLYDAPHNMAWADDEDPSCWIHRKGACPARGLDSFGRQWAHNSASKPRKIPYEFYGEPVLVPGSMGASSFILVGQGKKESLSSASHGAGRALSRGDSLKVKDGRFEEFMKSFRVVTPVDFRRQDIRMRRDIMDKKLEDIKKEAPYAYKGIGPIIDTLEKAGIAMPVVELRPLMTVKG